MRDIKSMSLREKIGQLFFVGFEDPFYDEHARKLIEDYKIGNIILFARNVQNMEQLVKLNKKIYEETVKNTGIIPFISIDQEGGMVTRIMNGATFCPGNMSLAATDNKCNAYKIGKIMGEELIRLGINFNLAPSLDVNNNPLNPVIGVRSYSDDPKMVSEFGNEFINGLQSEDVIATAKHFPGHGDTVVDSHLGLASLDFDFDRLNNVELVPFKSAIKHGVKAIMSAHIIFSELDDVPATLSHKLLTELLRNQLGFEGLLVSDCMQMKAIDNLYTTEQGTVRAINAGINIACVCHSLERQVGSFEAVYEAVKNGVISEDVIDERVERILKAKEEIYNTVKNKFIDQDVSDIVKYFYNIEEHKKVSQEIANESLTLVKGKAFTKKGSALLIGNVPFASTIAEDKLNSRNVLDMVSEYCDGIDTLVMDVNPENISEICDKAKAYDQVIFVTFNMNANKKQIVLANALSELKNDELYIISSRNPYDALYLNNTKNVCSLYEYTPLSVNTIVSYLNGNIKPEGTMPVNVFNKVDIGASVYVGLDGYTLESNIAYLEKLKKKNIKQIFISAHMAELNDNFEKEFESILKYAKENNFKIILDVNKTKLEELEEKGLSDGVYAMRLDYGFKKEDILKLQEKPYLIEMNASTINKKLLDFLVKNNADFSRFRLSHNFFPKPYTGLAYEKVCELNKMFHKYGFKVMAYMPTFKSRRGPLYYGLPTLEEMRNENVISNVNLLISAGCDSIFFGDAYANDIEIDQALDNSKDVLAVPIIIKKGLSDAEKEQLALLHTNRRDNSPYMIRSSVRGKQINEFNCVSIKAKDVTIDNYKYMRYMGEVGIALQDMEQRGEVNVVGRCVCSMNLLKAIDGGRKFRFIILGEE